MGKSTLVNALCGGKVAIVSDKPQTTRRRILGIATDEDHQLVLADLPGFQRPRDALTEHMQRTVDSAFEGVEAVLFVLSARERIGAGDRFIAGRVFGLGIPVVIALNKVDRLKPGHIATQMQAAARLGEFHALHPVSAKTGDGVGALREELVSLLPEGPLYFPDGERTDLLRDRLGFDGVVVTDALDAKSVAAVPHGPARALAAGVDLMLYSRTSASEEGYASLARDAAASATVRADLSAAIQRIDALKAWLAGHGGPACKSS